MTEPVFPSVSQPAMRVGHHGEAVTATVDNRTGLPDHTVLEAIRDSWVESAGLQFAQPNNFQLYSTGGQGSMLARTPFRTPQSVIDEIRLARTMADTDDDIAAAIGEMTAIAFGSGVTNQHRDEQTLEFFDQMTAPTKMDLEAVLQEMYREFLIAASVTTITLFTRQRLEYWPLKSDTPVQAQLQVPNVGILPAENIRVISNDVLGNGELAFHVEDENLKRWLEEFLNPKTDAFRKAIMAYNEPVAAALFIGRVHIPYNDGDPASRGMVLYRLNPRMVHRSCAPKGAMPYPRPFLTRNFALLEAKRLLNLMDYALLQGGTNYIVVAKKGTDLLPANQGEVDNLVNQVSHASRSGVMVGDHRLSIEIITPKLEELLNPAKRKLIGRKLKMGLLRQTEEVASDTGTQGALNEMELTARVVSSDRRKLVRHAQATFYDETATRNRTMFKMGAPSIWAPPIILSGVADFWANILQARDRGDIPRRWVVEALGFDYDAALAEREREIARGDDEVMMPASVPFSNGAGPQDNSPGRPTGSSSNNGHNGPSPGDGRDRFAPRHVIQRTAGETITAMVEDNVAHFIGETTRAILEEAGDAAEYNGYVTAPEREAIDYNQTIRSGQSVVVPVNPSYPCREYACVKLSEGLRMIVGQRIGDGAMVARALRFTEPHYSLTQASEYAIRWGFICDPLVETAKRKAKHCVNCGNALPGYSVVKPICENCGANNAPAAAPSAGPAGDTTAMEELTRRLFEEYDERARAHLASEIAKLQLPPPPPPPAPAPEPAPTA